LNLSAAALACHALVWQRLRRHRAGHRGLPHRSPPACFLVAGAQGSGIPLGRASCKIDRVRTRRKKALSLRSVFSQRKRTAHHREHHSRCALARFQPADRMTSASRSAPAPRTPERHWGSSCLLQCADHVAENTCVEALLNNDASPADLHRDAAHRRLRWLRISPWHHTYHPHAGWLRRRTGTSLTPRPLVRLSSPPQLRTPPPESQPIVRLVFRELLQRLAAGLPFLNSLSPDSFLVCHDTQHRVSRPL